MLRVLRFKKEHPDLYSFFKEVLGFTPRNVALYQMALIHRSKSVESDAGVRINNERLEYLGDAVLGAIVADMLYKKYPRHGEGFLTEMRSKLVSRRTLNNLAREMGLAALVQTSRDANGGFKSVDGDAFEALVGAIYLDRGFDFARRVVTDKIYRSYVDIDTLSHTDWNYKSKLIDWGQKTRNKVSFEVENVIPQRRNCRAQYDVRVKINDEPREHAVDFSIKAAEQHAAEKTYMLLIQSAEQQVSATLEDATKAPEQQPAQ